MVSLNWLFALAANSIQNLDAFSLSIGVFKTCIFICAAKSAVSIKMLNWIIIFASSSCILIQLNNVSKPRPPPSSPKIYFLNFSPMLLSSLLYIPSPLPRSCSTQQSGFHLHACTVLVKRVWVSVVHSPRTPSCDHTCLSPLPCSPSTTSLYWSKVK